MGADAMAGRGPTIGGWTDATSAAARVSATASHRASSCAPVLFLSPPKVYLLIG